MRNVFCLVFIFLSLLTVRAQDKFQLAPPLLEYASAFSATGQVSCVMIFDQPGAEIRYTLNGKEPTINDSLYRKPVLIKGTRVQLKTRAFGKNFLPSETVKADFVIGGKKIKKISFQPPHESYAAAPLNILNDEKGGQPSYGNGHWIGYNSDTVEIEIELAEKEMVQRVILNLLQDENSWIFLPEKITIYYFSEQEKKFLLMNEIHFKDKGPGPKQCLIVEAVSSPKMETARLKIVIETVKKIPAWHSGKDSHAWFFIDEIKVY